jgi:hypothetical protein
MFCRSLFLLFNRKPQLSDITWGLCGESLAIGSLIIVREVSYCRSFITENWPKKLPNKSPEKTQNIPTKFPK